MLFNDRTREAIKARREEQAMRAKGYFLVEPDWRLIRGAHHDKRIEDVRIASGGKHLWVRTGADGQP